MKRIGTVLSIVCTLCIGCIATLFADTKMPVFVSILPQKFFVEKIGGALVDVNVMVQPGSSPHTFEPKPRQMVSIAKSNLYFAIGVEFEKIWLDRIAATNPSMKIVYMDQGIVKIPMQTHPEEAQERNEYSDADHDHHHESDGMDPHIWLSPQLIKQQVLTILKALQQSDTAHYGIYQTNYQQLLQEIEELDMNLKTTLTGRSGMRFLVFHPSWGYFARDYDLIQVPVEIEGKVPKPAQLQYVIQLARKQHIKVIFAQPQFSTRSASIIANEIGGEVILVDPLAEDWGTNMNIVAGKIKKALK